MDFVRADVGLPSAWDGLQAQIYLGSEAFIEHIQSHCHVVAGEKNNTE